MKVGRDTLDGLEAHARGAHPEECCGVLLARRDAPSTVSLAIRAKNAEAGNRERGYVLGHEAHLEAARRESTGAWTIAGYYHSHPDGGTRPSSQDGSEAADGAVYLIVGVQGEGTGHAAWRYEGDRFVPEPVEVIR